MQEILRALRVHINPKPLFLRGHETLLHAPPHLTNPQKYIIISSFFYIRVAQAFDHPDDRY